VQAIESRISHFTYTPVPNGELLQILRYEKDQYYKPHHDYFSDEVRPSASDTQKMSRQHPSLTQLVYILCGGSATFESSYPLPDARLVSQSAESGFGTSSNERALWQSTYYRFLSVVSLPVGWCTGYADDLINCKTRELRNGGRRKWARVI
jgi:hypothetical protein